ncbi:MAG: transposase [Balneolaceae bacterium]
MGRSRYKIHEEHYPYFITSSIVDYLPLFTFPEVADVILEVLTFLQDEREVKLYAYVIMENHIHFIVEGGDLKKKLRLSKSFAANRIIDVLKTRGHSKILGG